MIIVYVVRRNRGRRPDRRGHERQGGPAVRAGCRLPVRRVRGATRGPGLALIAPVADRLQKVNMQIITMPVPAQDGITRDNVTVRVDAVVYFRVVDPVRAAVDVAGLRLGHRPGRAGVAALDHRQERPGRPAVQPGTAQPGPGADDRQPGARLGRAHRPGRDQGRRAAGDDEAVDVAAGRGGTGTPLPRDHRRRRTAGLGETGPGRRGHGRHTAALQLRLLQTVVEVAAEKNSTLVLPFPVELLRFLERSTPADSGRPDAGATADPAQDEPESPAAAAELPVSGQPPARPGRSQRRGGAPVGLTDRRGGGDMTAAAERRADVGTRFRSQAA